MHTHITSKVEGSILYEPSLLGKPEQQAFDPEYWLARGVGTAMTGGRGQVLFIRDDQRKWVLRHYRRGGLIANFNTDSYLWLGADATRSFREWHLLAKLIELELPVPVPIAARYVRHGLTYRADLITQEIIGARSLASCLADAPLTSVQWQLIGKTLARFHRYGVQHADLNAHNIVFDQNGSVFVLDFDRGVIGSHNQQWVDKVLARLLRSLEKLRAGQSIHFNADVWTQLVVAHDSVR